MSIKITYFVHGTSQDNENHISSGWSDVELSELGIKQSIELRKHLKNLSFNAVFSSDLKRALQSAKLSFGDQIKIISDSRLRECNYGKYNAFPSEIVEPQQEKNIINKFPGGESYQDVERRVRDFIKFLTKNYSGKSIAIVSHKAPQLALDVLLKGLSWEEAFAHDWRKNKAWQPGWDYIIN